MELLSQEECRSLRHALPETPQHDVLEIRHADWKKVKNSKIDIQIKNKKILLVCNGDEILLTTPAVVAQTCCLSGDGLKGWNPKDKHKNQYQCMFLKGKKPSENTFVTQDVLSMFDEHDDFFNFIEQLVTDLLYKAFLDPELMQLATDFAWDQVNMDDPSDMEQQAFSIFMSRAKLPYTDKSWTLRKNVYKRMRNVVSKTYVPVYDIQNVEHTGSMEPSNGAILQLSMRLWPYHMSENTYGVSAQISDYGAKIYHSGGLIPSHRKWQPSDYIIIKDANKWRILDSRGGIFRIQTPVVDIHTINGNQITICINRQKYETFIKQIKILEDHIKDAMGVKKFTDTVKYGKDDSVFISFIAPPGYEWKCGDKSIITLKSITYQLPNDTGGLKWVVDKKTDL